MAEQITIATNERKVGKGNSGKLRRDRQVPAVVYGPKQENTNLVLEQNDAVKYTSYGFENTIFNLNGGPAKNIKVLVKDVTRHPVTQIPTHIDFYAPDMTKTVRVNVEIKYEGKPAGAQEGGLLNVLAREVEIECLPTDIPDSFTMDVSELALNQSFHLSDLSIPEKYRVMTSAETTLCSCAAVEEKAEEAAAPAEGEAAPAAESK